MLAAVLVHGVGEGQVGVVEVLVDVAGGLAHLPGGGQQRLLLGGEGVLLLPADAGEGQAVVLQAGLLLVEALHGLVADVQDFRGGEGRGLVRLDEQVHHLAAHLLGLGIPGVLVPQVHGVAGKGLAHAGKLILQLEEFQQPLGALAQGALAGPQAVDGRLDFGDVRLPGLIAGVQIGGSPSVLGVQLTAGGDFLFAHIKVLSFLPYSNHTTVGTMAQYSTAGAPGEALGEIFRTGKKGPAKLQQPFWDQYRITLVSPVLFV